MTSSRSTGILLGILLLFSPSFAYAKSIRHAKNPVRDTYIVRLQPDSNSEKLGPELSRKHGGYMKQHYRSAINGFTVVLPRAAAEAMLNDSRVLSIEEDAIAEYSATQTVGMDLWNLDRVDQRSRPPYGTGYQGAYTYCATGSPVKIFILDSGVMAMHMEFRVSGPYYASRVTSGYDVTPEYYTGVARGGSADFPCPNPPECAPGESCWPFQSATSAYMLNGGHGTAVASLAAGNTFGIAKRATVVPVRVGDCFGWVRMSAVIAAIEWILQTGHIPGSPAVANMSFGWRYPVACTDLYSKPDCAEENYYTYRAAVEEAVDNMIDAGISVVAAAGNQSVDVWEVSPARIPRVITVAATDLLDARWTSSNWGSGVDLFAPGHNVRSAHIFDHWSERPDGERSGTSFAAPMVTGAIAKYLEVHPSATPADVAWWITTNATANAVYGAGSSPNRLLYTPCE